MKNYDDAMLYLDELERAWADDYDDGGDDEYARELAELEEEEMFS